MTSVTAAAALASLIISVFTLLLVLGIARRIRSAGPAKPAGPRAGGAVTLPALGRPVPEFRFVDVEGAPVVPDRLRTGRHVVAFVSSSCDACVDSVPGFVELAGSLGKERALAVLLDDGDDRSLAAALMQRLRAASTLLIESHDRDVSKLFDIVSFPSFVGIENGVVRLASHRVAELSQWSGQ